MEIRMQGGHDRRSIERRGRAHAPDADSDRTDRLLALEELRGMGRLSHHEFFDAARRLSARPKVA